MSSRSTSVGRVVLRPKFPDGFYEEAHGYLLTQYAIRSLMHDAAVEAGLGPDASLSCAAPLRRRHSLGGEVRLRQPGDLRARAQDRRAPQLVRIHPGSGRIALTAAASARWSRVRRVVAALDEYEFIPAYRRLAVAWGLRVAGWYGLWQDSTGRREETYGLLDGVGGRPMRARAGC